MTRIVALCIALLSFSTAHAVELTLEECMEKALASHGSVKSAELAVSASGEDITISRAGFLPSLKMKGTYTLVDKPERLIINNSAFGPGVPAGDVELSTGERDYYGMTMTLQQPLFTGGSLTHGYAKSRAANAEARINLERQKKLLRLETKRSFNEALNSQLHLKTVTSMTRAKQERLRVLKELATEGYARKDEILQQETDLAFTELELTKSTNNAEFALSRLRRLLYLPDNEDLRLKGMPTNTTLTVPLQEIKPLGNASREELHSIGMRLTRMEEEIGIARSGFYPQASLQGSYLLQKETNLARPQVWMLAATVDWPLFEWGRTKSEVARATARRQSLVIERDELARNIALEIEQIWREEKDREQSIKAHEIRLQTAEFRMGKTLKQYEEGTVKLADVMDTEADLIKASNDYIIALNDLNSTLARLEAAVSSPLDTWLARTAIYQPDLAGYNERLKSLTAGKRAARMAPHPAQKPAVKTPAAPAPSPKPVEKGAALPTVVKPVEKAATLPTTNKPAQEDICIQAGAYRSRQYAEELKKSLAVKPGTQKISVIMENKLYKVIVSGVADRTEAAQVAQRLGLQNYFIRSGHGL